MQACTGAYACVGMLAGFGLIAFRDPNGIRPAGLATRQGSRGGTDYMVASESVVAQGLSFSGWEDIKAGQCSHCYSSVMFPGANLFLLQVKLSLSLVTTLLDDELPNQRSLALTSLNLYISRDQTRPLMVSAYIELVWQWETF